jgi:hypothetical protein
MCVAALAAIPAFFGVGGATAGAASAGSGLATAASLLGTAASVGGVAISGIAASNAAKAQEMQDRNNAVIAQRNAADARARGAVAEQELQMRTRAAIGKQVNVLSERNIALNIGSPLDIIGDTAMFGKLDALTTRQNFEREAIGHESQAAGFSASAAQARLRSSASMWGMGAGLFQTALGGVTDYYKARDMRL